MTFTDIDGKQVVVDVGSNGDYSADLTSLAQGKVTYLVSETDTAGNTISFDPPIRLGEDLPVPRPGRRRFLIC